MSSLSVLKAGFVSSAQTGLETALLAGRPHRGMGSRQGLELARLGYGQDWTYAGWFQHMLHVTHPDALPTTSRGDGVSDEGCLTDYMLTFGRSLRLPLPPPGGGTE